MEEKVFREIYDKAINFRGRIINAITLLERHIDVIISDYFCGTNPKSDELMNVVFATNKITFDSKREVLKYVLTKGVYINILNDNPSLFSDLIKIGDFRNILAHHPICTTEEADKEYLDNNKIGFTKFKNSADDHFYSEDEIKKYEELILDYMNYFRGFMGAKTL